MKLHPVASDVKCPHCGRGPLEFISVYLNYGDKYRCASCKNLTIHQRRKATNRCGLAPLLKFSIFGAWKEDACQSVPVAAPSEQTGG